MRIAWLTVRRMTNLIWELKGWSPFKTSSAQVSFILQEGSWREMLAFLSSKEDETTSFIEEISKAYNFPESRHNTLRCVDLSSYLSQFYSCLLAAKWFFLSPCFPFLLEDLNGDILTYQLIFLSFSSKILVLNHVAFLGWYFSLFS